MSEHGSPNIISQSWYIIRLPRSVTKHLSFTVSTCGWFYRFGVETLKLEDKFNGKAGFNAEEEEFPSFFYDEKLELTGKRARHHYSEVRELRQTWYAEQAAAGD